MKNMFISILEVRKPSKGEIKFLSSESKEYLVRNDNIIYFSPNEIDNRKKLLIPFLKRIKTSDGIAYVTIGREVLSSCNPLLIRGMYSRFPNYTLGTYQDITFLSGKMISSSLFHQADGKISEKKLRYRIPAKKWRYHIFFYINYSDMI